jgi:hypothetical protein
MLLSLEISSRYSHDGATLPPRSEGQVAMSGDNPLTRGQREHASERLAITAYVAADKANCLYEPDPKSAVRVVPPYGTEVEVIRDEGSWILIRFSDKEAWCPRANLSVRLAPKGPAVNVGVVPPPNHTFRSPPYAQVVLPPVEYGPRGGRFVRTATGFRRYF